MKKRFALITIVLLLVSFASVFGQWTTNHSRYADNSKLVLYFAGTLDSLNKAPGIDSLKSSLFSLEDYDQSGTYFSFNYVFTSTTGAPNICVDLYGTDDGGVNSYKIAQIVDTTNSEVYTPVAFNLSNWRFNQYYLIFEQVAPGRDNSTFKAWLHSPQKDPALKP